MISIIVPVFNAADTIEETINSAINSGVNQQEIILVDDCSSDFSLKILEAYQNKYSFIHVYKNCENLGGGATRNIGISHAKYDYIFVLDSDDVLVPGALSRALDELIDRDVDGIANGCLSSFVKDIRQPVFKYNFVQGPVSFEALFDSKPNPVIGNLLFKKSAYKDVLGYPEFHGFDTQCFGFRLLANRKKIITCNFQIYHQRRPVKPSYYVREMRAGRLNKNWLLIFLESFYKFDISIRNWILKYPIDNPFMLAKDVNLFTKLINMNNIFCVNNLYLNDASAYENYKNSPDETLMAWCLIYEIKSGQVDKAFSKIYLIKNKSIKNMIIYYFLSSVTKFSIDREDSKKIEYLFFETRSFIWMFKFYLQKILNRLRRFFI